MKIQRKKSNVDEPDSFEESIADLLQVMSESIKNTYEHQAEPYERYVARLRMRFYEDPKAFSQRFKKGYKVLLDQIKSN